MNRILLLIILICGSLIRLYRLEELMLFIGDQGWFYLQARDLIISGQFPLVGITSSHIWLHQGPFWTYILGASMNLFGFNPVYGSYLTVISGVFTIWLVYFIGKRMFSEGVGLLSAVVYSFSPLVIIHSRMSYHTSLIPLFSTILIYIVFRWMSGNVNYFPLIILLLAVLYNFELATFAFVPVVVVIFFYGLYKKRQWAKGVLNMKILSRSLILFLIPMLPMIIYDMQNGFNQTLRFGIWVIYRIAVFFGYPPLHPSAPTETWGSFIPYALTLLQRFTYLQDLYLSIAIILTTFVVICYKLRKEHENSYLILFLSTAVPILGFIAVKTNSEPYTLVFLPTLAISLGVTFHFFIKNKQFKVPEVLLLALLVTVNVYTLISEDYLMNKGGYGIPYSERIRVVGEIIQDANKKPYNLIGSGEFSKYESFLSGYEYIAWFMGYPPSEDEQKTQFYVSEHTDRIKVERK